MLKRSSCLNQSQKISISLLGLKFEKNNEILLLIFSGFFRLHQEKLINYECLNLDPPFMNAIHESRNQIYCVQTIGKVDFGFVF